MNSSHYLQKTAQDRIQLRYWRGRERSELGFNGNISDTMPGWSQTKEPVSGMPPQCGGATLGFQICLEKEQTAFATSF